MIIGPTVSVTRGPAWILTDEFTHIAFNTCVPPLSDTFTNIFHLFPVVVVVLGHGSCLYGWPRLLPWKVHVMHLMWVFICLKNRLSLSLSLRVSIRISSTEGERERAAILPAGNNSTTYLATHDRCIKLGRRRGGIHTHTTPLMAMALVLCVVLQMTALGWWINV